MSTRRAEIRGPSNQLQGVLDDTIMIHKIESFRSEVILCWEVLTFFAQLLKKSLLEFNQLVKTALIFPLFSTVYYMCPVDIEIIQEVPTFFLLGSSQTLIFLSYHYEKTLSTQNVLNALLQPCGLPRSEGIARNPRDFKWKFIQRISK